MFDRERRGALTATAGATLSLVGTFLPWLRSGARNRSSYTIFDLVERLGFAPGGVVAWSLRLWPIVPLLLVLSAVTAWAPAIGRSVHRWTTVLTAFTVLWIAGTAIALLRAPDVGLFRVGVGPYVTLIGAFVLGAGAWPLSAFRSGQVLD